VQKESERKFKVVKGGYCRPCAENLLFGYALAVIKIAVIVGLSGEIETVGLYRIAFKGADLRGLACSIPVFS
jgi:hypothetical protein